MPEQLTPPLVQLTPDLYKHMQNLHPESYEFKAEFGALNELARETGHAVLTMDSIFPPVSFTPPEGYSSEMLIPHGAELPTEQFKKIRSLHPKGTSITLDVRRLVTDSGKEMRLSDLRPHMTAAVRDGGPQNEKRQEELNQAVYKDLKFMLETNHPKRSVTDMPRVGYTRLGNGLERAYWMIVEDHNAYGVKTVARLADSATIPGEEHLYQRVFGKHLSK